MSALGRAMADALGGAPVGTAADNGYWECFECPTTGRAGATQADAAAALNAHRRRDHPQSVEDR